MDPKQFQNNSVRRHFASANFHEIFPTLHFICNVMEKHVKKDQRKQGRYKLVHLIEKVSKFDLKNVPIESLSENDKELLEAKANAAIEEFYKIRWSKKLIRMRRNTYHRNSLVRPHLRAIFPDAKGGGLTKGGPH